MAHRRTGEGQAPRSPAPLPGPSLLDDLKAVGRIIWSHLFSEAARNVLSHTPTTDLFLRLDDQLVHIPWELAFNGQDFLVTKFRIARQVLTQTPSIRHPTLDSRADLPLGMLIIIDPTETLAGAEAEAHELCALLDQHDAIDVCLMGGQHLKKFDILKALNEADLVHYAGHAAFDPAHPGNSGWLLQDGVLTASEISRPEDPPVLVFSNACQAGATVRWAGDYRYEGEAFGLGSGFLLAGVQHYIGALWVVHDERSAGFGAAFYRHLLQGRTIGEALLRARHRSIEAYGWEELLWAGYLHYDNPRFRLPSRLFDEAVEAELLPEGPSQGGPAPGRRPSPALSNLQGEPADVGSGTGGSQVRPETIQTPMPRPRMRWALIALALGGGLIALLAVWGLLPGKEGRPMPWAGPDREVRTAQPIVEQYRQAFADFRGGNVNAALARFRALAAAGENPLGLGYDGLATAYFEAGLPEKALEALEEALARNPGHAMAHLLWGDILFTQGKRDDSLKAYQLAARGTALLPWQQAAAQTALGVFYSLQGAWDKAREAFNQAIVLDPSYPEAYGNLGHLAWREQRNAEATRWLTKAQALQPMDEIAQYYRHLLQKSATARTTAGTSLGPRLLILPFSLVGGNLRRLGTGEMLAGLAGQALSQEGGITVLTWRDLDPALQGKVIDLPGQSDVVAALNVAKMLRADLILYGSHRSYENLLALDVRAVRVKTTEVLATEHLRTQGKDKLHAAARVLIDKLKPIVADAAGKASR